MKLELTVQEFRELAGKDLEPHQDVMKTIEENLDKVKYIKVDYISFLQKEESRLQNSVSHLKEQIAEKDSLVEKQRARILALEQTNERVNKEADILNGECTALIRDYSTHRDEGAKKILLLTAQLNEANATVARLSALLAKVEKSNCGLCPELFELRSELENLTNPPLTDQQIKDAELARGE